jgi:hypothetical protein
MGRGWTLRSAVLAREASRLPRSTEDAVIADHANDAAAEPAMR